MHSVHYASWDFLIHIWASSSRMGKTFNIRPFIFFLRQHWCGLGNEGIKCYLSQMDAGFELLKKNIQNNNFIDFFHGFVERFFHYIEQQIWRFHIKGDFQYLSWRFFQSNEKIYQISINKIYENTFLTKFSSTIQIPYPFGKGHTFPANTSFAF